MNALGADQGAPSPRSCFLDNAALGTERHSLTTIPGVKRPENVLQLLMSCFGIRERVLERELVDLRGTRFLCVPRMIHTAVITSSP